MSYEQHFGGVYYLFLRGMDPSRPGFGIHRDRLEEAFVRKLNALHGSEVGYHVLGNSTPRHGEPDLYLVTIHKDFLKIAEGLAVEKKINEAMAKDRAQFEKEGAARAPMRTVMGNLELIEFKLK